MSVWIDRIDRTFYQGVERNWDDELLRKRILAVAQASFVVLDLGAGAGIVPQMNFRGLVAKVCGVDLDPRVKENPMLDDGRVSDAAGIPYRDGLFDIVFADNVLEHLAQPDVVFAEAHRVLKPGGLLFFKTPNKWHYMPLIARVTPHRFHRFVNRLRGRAESDTFPTLYRANCSSAVIELAGRTGFEVVSLERIEGRPEYLRMTWPTYLLGTCYERVVNSSGWLAPLRIVLIGQLRKPA